MQTLVIGDVVGNATTWLDAAGYDQLLVGISSTVTTDAFVIEGATDQAAVALTFLGNLLATARQNHLTGIQITSGAGSVANGPARIAWVRVRRTVAGAGATTIFVIPVANAGAQAPTALVVPNAPSTAVGTWVDVSGSQKIVLGTGAGWGVDDVVVIEQDVDDITPSTSGTRIGEIKLGQQLLVQGPAGVLAARRISGTTNGLQVAVARSAYAFPSTGVYPLPGANTQLTWYIDPLTGLNTNTGLTALTALADLGEWVNRVGQQPISGAMTVYIMSDDTGNYEIAPFLDVGGSVLITGEQARTVIYDNQAVVVVGGDWAAPAMDGQYTLPPGDVTAAVANHYRMAEHPVDYTNTAPIPIDLGDAGVPGNPGNPIDTTETVFAGATPAFVDVYSTPKLGGNIAVCAQGNGVGSLVVFTDLDIAPSATTRLGGHATLITRCTVSNVFANVASLILNSTHVTALTQSEGIVTSILSVIGGQVPTQDPALRIIGSSTFSVGAGNNLVLGSVKLDSGRCMLTISSGMALCVSRFSTRAAQFGTYVNPGQTIQSDGFLFWLNYDRAGTEPSVSVKSTGAILYGNVLNIVVNDLPGPALVDYKIGGTSKGQADLPYLEPANLAAIVQNQ